jgi:hypothetical protein
MDLGNICSIVSGHGVPREPKPLLKREAKPTVPTSQWGIRHCGSLDHLVRQEQDGRWDREAQRLGGLQVDDQLKFRGLLHRQVGGLGALEDLVHIGGRAAPALKRLCRKSLKTGKLRLASG